MNNGKSKSTAKVKQSDKGASTKDTRSPKTLKGQVARKSK